MYVNVTAALLAQSWPLLDTSTDTGLSRVKDWAWFRVTDMDVADTHVAEYT
jgi:hypothetical protein